MEKFPSGCAAAGAPGGSATPSTPRDQGRPPHRSASIALAPPVSGESSARPAEGRCAGTAAASPARPGRARRHAGVEAEQRDPASRARSARRGPLSPARGRPARVSAHPSASAERMLGAARHTRRPSRTARGRIAVVRLEEHRLGVRRRPRRAESRCSARAAARSARRGRRMPAAGSTSARRVSAGGERKPVRRAPQEGHGAAQVPPARRRPARVRPMGPGCPGMDRRASRKARAPRPDARAEARGRRGALST